MEEAAELGNYLPLSFKTRSEQDYIAFLWDAFETNYTHGKYQFAFLAYHMLTMSFVYFNIWQIRQARPEDFGKGLIGFGKDIEKNLVGSNLALCLQQRERAQHPAPAQAHRLRQRQDRHLRQACG